MISYFFIVLLVCSSVFAMESSKTPEALAQELLALPLGQDLEKLCQRADSHEKKQEISKILLERYLGTFYQISGLVNANVQKIQKEKIGPTSISESFDSGSAQLYHINCPAQSISLDHDGSHMSLTKTNNTSAYFTEKGLVCAINYLKSTVIASKCLDQPGLILTASKNCLSKYNNYTGTTCSNDILSQNVKMLLLTSRGKFALFHHYDEELEIVKSDGKERNTFPNRSKTPIAFAMSDDGSWGLIAYQNKLKKFHYKDKKPTLSDFKCQRKNFVSVDITPDGKYGLLATNQEIVRVSTENCQGETAKELKTIIAAAISSCGNYAVTGHWDGHVKLVEFANKSCLAQFDAPGEHFSTVAISGDNYTIAAGSQSFVYKASCKKIIAVLSNEPPSLILSIICAFADKQLLTDYPFLLEKFLMAPIPYKKQLIAKYEIDPETINAVCPVCFVNFADSVTKCKHIFCGDCLKKLGQSNNNNCPICRRDLSSNNP
jgi:hypothetical protein